MLEREREREREKGSHPGKVKIATPIRRLARRRKVDGNEDGFKKERKKFLKKGLKRKMLLEKDFLKFHFYFARNRCKFLTSNH